MLILIMLIGFFLWCVISPFFPNERNSPVIQNNINITNKHTCDNQGSDSTSYSRNLHYYDVCEDNLFRKDIF